MRRLLLTTGYEKCPFGCTYCFSNFSDYKRPLDIASIELNPEILESLDVIYPACDIDLFALTDPIQHLIRFEQCGKSISISTKAELSWDMVSELSELAGRFGQAGAIFKIGISITCKRGIQLFEPYTATYQQRLNNLAMLADAAISTCVVIKPILADIPLDEYLEIVNDVSPLSNLFLLGDHYLGPPARNARVQKVGRKISRRRVRWAPGQPVWDVEIPLGYAEEIKRAIKEHGALSFDSDLEVMAHLLEKKPVSRVQKVSML